jgi:hypothetical protein
MAARRFPPSWSVEEFWMLVVNFVISITSN